MEDVVRTISESSQTGKEVGTLVPAHTGTWAWETPTTLLTFFCLHLSANLLICFYLWTDFLCSSATPHFDMYQFTYLDTHWFTFFFSPDTTHSYPGIRNCWPIFVQISIPRSHDHGHGSMRVGTVVKENLGWQKVCLVKRNWELKRQIYLNR